LPGQADDSFTVQFGNGRSRTGRVGTGVGFNGYLVRKSTGLWTASGSVKKTGGSYKLAATQHHHMMEGRELVRSAAHAEFEKNPRIFESEHDNAKHEDLFPPHEYKGYAWGMAIDLSACVGCNACMIACVAENNIPVVGKDQVMRGREMHWIRIDRYYAGELDDPRTHHQPVMCMQCEQAPCEVVCPVGATNHSSEGLNDMVYNRCVGTRYCSTSSSLSSSVTATMTTPPRAFVRLTRLRRLE
jgi:molybdopterin-containing oxidoreductase family iron-sulfur binding subunit